MTSLVSLSALVSEIFNDLGGGAFRPASTGRGLACFSLFNWVFFSEFLWYHFTKPDGFRRYTFRKYSITVPFSRLVWTFYIIFGSKLTKMLRLLEHRVLLKEQNDMGCKSL